MLDGLVSDITNPLWWVMSIILFVVIISLQYKLHEFRVKRRLRKQRVLPEWMEDHR